MILTIPFCVPHAPQPIGTQGAEPRREHEVELGLVILFPQKNGKKESVNPAEAPNIKHAETIKLIYFIFFIELLLSTRLNNSFP